MLSSALQKANTAVLLDNANNFEGAMEAYGDACVLLGHVMMRAGAEEDRRKLMIIRDTYSRRIDELKALSPKYRGPSEKELPARPDSDDFSDPDNFDESSLATAPNAADKTTSLPPRRDSLLPSSAGYTKAPSSKFRGRDTRQLDIPEEVLAKESFEESRSNAHRGTMGQQLPIIHDNYSVGVGYVPETHNRKTSTFKHHRTSSGAELAGRDGFDSGQNHGAYDGVKSSSRASFRPTYGDLHFDQGFKVPVAPLVINHSQQQQQQQQHLRGDSEVSTSWLNTVDESGGSMSESSSRTGSRTGSRPGSSRSRIRRMRMAAKQDKFGSGSQDNEAEVIGAEIDAAVDAAWDAFSSDAESEQNVGILMREPDQDIEVVAEAQQRSRDDRKDSDVLLDQGSDIFGHDRTGARAGDEFGRPLLAREGEGYSHEGSSNADEEVLFFKGEQRSSVERASEHSRGSSLSKPAPMRFSSGDKQDGSDTPQSTTSDDEDERILYSSKGNYQLDDFDFGGHSKSNVPRESISSGASASTWGSSLASSNGLNPGPPLQTVTELPLESPIAERSDSPPPGALSGMNTKASATGTGVRNRRSGRPLSGINGPLTIEIASTSQKPTSGTAIELFEEDLETATIAVSAIAISPRLIDTKGSLKRPVPPLASPPPMPRSANPAITMTSRPSSSVWNESADEQAENSSKTNSRDDVEMKGLTSADSLSGFNRRDFDDDEATLTEVHQTGSPIAKLHPRMTGSLRHIQSSQSLKHRTLGTPDPDISSPMIPTLYPSASSSNLRSAKGPHLALNYTQGSYSSMSTAGLPTAGFHLFDNKMHSPSTPGTPSVGSAALQALEAMPTEPLAKPYWLMRCFYQTIAHPRGGYLSSRLFVPREVWMMKGVKLKAVDEKIAVSESLTAALTKLATIDKDDIDVLLTEMQELEAIMTRTEAILLKKLGNEVGAKDAEKMFKSDGFGQENFVSSSDSAKTTGTSGGSKSAFSWKKLRSKNSTSAINSAFSSTHASFQPATPIEPQSSAAADSYGFSGSDGLEMAGKKVGNTTIGGPHAMYLSALAGLFDAAQVLDRISSHLEGNSLAVQTQVGLELSLSRSSEFFGWFVCRFVLADISLLLDKFIKKGTEWAAA